MPPRNTDETALNWHYTAADLCALNESLIVFGHSSDEVLPHDALQCIKFLETTAIRAHLSYDVNAVQAYIAILERDNSFARRRDDAVPAYRSFQP